MIRHRDDHFTAQGRTLGRFEQDMQALEDRQKIARILTEVDAELPVDDDGQYHDPTRGGDTRRMRGIPITAAGVPGTSPGTDPLSEALRSDHRLRYHRKCA